MYDFSGISTEELKHAVDYNRKNHGVMCAGIDCLNNNCPFSKHITGILCRENKNSNNRNKLFKEELNRREKDMEKMPELKHGQIVEMDTKFNSTRYCVLIPTDKGLTLITKEWCRWGDLDKTKILKIYNNKSSNFNAMHERNDLSNLELIWSRKSEKDIEIEEIQKEMDKLNKRMEGLKSDN